MNNPLTILADIAESQIGTREDKANTNKGEAIKKYQNATELEGQGWPWCVAFVVWCILEVINKYPKVLGVRKEERPRMASVYLFKQWAKTKHPTLVFTDHTRAQRGDIVIYNFSHIGIVSSNDKNGLKVVEGNTNEAGGREGNIVAKKDRSLNLKQIECYIRLPVLATLQK